jgi:hypothetical protein
MSFWMSIVPPQSSLWVFMRKTCPSVSLLRGVVLLDDMMLSGKSGPLAWAPQEIGRKPYAWPSSCTRVVGLALVPMKVMLPSPRGESPEADVMQVAVVGTIFIAQFRPGQGLFT